jgi:hypothetical protein
LQFELAGPRDKSYFDPAKTRAGIVKCGGLCPGLNDVIRSLYLELNHAYGVSEVLGFRGGYQGLDPDTGNKPFQLTHDFVDDIHQDGGTVLGTSPGPVDVKRAVDNLVNLGINILFTIGGDGTQRGGNALFQEAKKRGHALSVVGIPKTIDNDVAFVSRTFGYLTAVHAAMAWHGAQFWRQLVSLNNSFSLFCFKLANQWNLHCQLLTNHSFKKNLRLNKLGCCNRRNRFCHFLVGFVPKFYEIIIYFKRCFHYCISINVGKGFIFFCIFFDVPGTLHPYFLTANFILIVHLPE